jgi:hypothetical protein
MVCKVVNGIYFRRRLTFPSTPTKAPITALIAIIIASFFPKELATGTRSRYGKKPKKKKSLKAK